MPEERISDFKIHNNIYNDVSDWKSQYSSSCTGISCASLFPSVDYGKCDQWCASETEWFLPLLEPILYGNTPYLTIYEDLYHIYATSPIYKEFSIPPAGWSDYSITGWFQFPSCHSQLSNIFSIGKYLQVNLDSDTSICDKLTAEIWSSDDINTAYDSTAVIGSNFIGSWVFFALTIKSSSKLFTIYAKNSVNPLSATYPLASSSIVYTYTAKRFNSDTIIDIGGSFAPYPGNYADFRIYPGNHIDSTLLQYNNNIYSAATYLDPHCISWESIWYCNTCEIGYFIKNGICQKCHYSCSSCSSDAETNCLSCASGYYAQPGHPSMCFDYCPLGYSKDFSLNKCTGTQGAIVNIIFDDNLLWDFGSSILKLKFADKFTKKISTPAFMSSCSANKRGLYIGSLENDHFSFHERGQDIRILSMDFTMEFWVMPLLFQGSSFYSAYLPKPRLDHIKLFKKEENLFEVTILTKENDIATVNLSEEMENKEWAFYSLSVSYDDLSKTSQIILGWNQKYVIKRVPSYYREVSGMNYFVAVSLNGFLYSFSLYNYGKNHNEIIQNLGTCSSCPACPGILNSCLPTCDKTEYVDDNGNCQKCSKSCLSTCARTDSCNLCYDDLCEKCTKYEIGACIQCVNNAELKNGQCECKSGFIREGSQCVNECNDGHYFDWVAQSCLSCPDNCLKCSDGDFCNICKNEFFARNGKCECSDGYFWDSAGKCLKCENSCSTCSIISSNCTSCISDLPIRYDDKCYPCDSFEGYSTYFTVPISYFTDDLFSQLSSKCIEICGDGKNMRQSSCDDGNNNNGDGCSLNCTIENGWSCIGGSVNTPDICKDTTPPSPILAYLSENNSGYLLALSFSESVNIAANLSENIQITIDPIKKFSWSILQNKAIYIISLKPYENIEIGTSVKLIFIDPDTITDMSGNQMKEKSVATNLLIPFTYSISLAIEASVTTATTVVAATAIVGSISSGLVFGAFNIKALWGMIEMMQMQYYLIFLSVKYPDNLMSYMRALSIANGSFLPNPFQTYLIIKDPFQDPPSKFVDENFNTDFLMNAGQFVTIWVIILTGIPISIILFKLKPKLSLVRWLKNSYEFSILLRTGIESLLIITLSIFLQIKGIEDPNQDLGYLSLALSFLFMICLIFTFALIIWQVTLKSEETLNIKQHERRFGVLYEDFKRNSKLTASFLLFQNFRRIMFIIFCVLLHDYTSIQVLLSVILSLIYTILLIILRPYEKRFFGNYLNIACEILYVAASCLILKFLDSQLSDSYRDNIGISIIVLLGTSLLLHTICLFIVQITNLIEGLIKLKKWFMKNFANKFAEVKRRVILQSNKPYNYGIEINEEIKTQDFYSERASKAKMDRAFSDFDAIEDESFRK